jgi:sulfide:quinone oxidoreductase
MLDTRSLSADLSVGPQVAPEDMDRLRALGFNSLICNRPDGEARDQPLFATIAEAARAAGLQARHVPVAAPIPEDVVAAFREATRDLPGPVFAFCRTGTRSASLWALAEAANRGTEAVLERAARAGYDLTGLAPLVHEAEAGGFGDASAGT